ncbi:hypothetical protein ACWGDE_18750 [Streptomyces sp. NPDC054956]
MYLEMAAVELTASPQAPRQRLDPNLLSDVLWACAEPDDRTQHLTVMTRDGRADLVLYFLAESTEAARTAALHGVRRAIATSPMLSGWTAREIPLDATYPFGTPDLETPP